MRRERKVASRAVVRGLGKVEPTSTDTLIAYAAKAGSTADDGDGLHSPFTAAVLKNLTVPGLDVRLAFGRVRDEVLKDRQPAGAVRLRGARRRQYLVGAGAGGAAGNARKRHQGGLRTGSEDRNARAWEVFLGTHPRASMPTSRAPRSRPPTADARPNINRRRVPHAAAPSRETPSKEALEWDRVKDSTDPAALQQFIKRFPDSPLSISAQQRIDLLKKAAQEREEKARADARGGAQGRRGSARQAEQRRAEQAAAKKREEDERRARAGGSRAEGKGRRSRTQAAEAKQRAEQAERDRAAAEAAAQRAAAEQQAKAAEAEQKAKAAEAERKATEEKRKAEHEAAAARLRAKSRPERPKRRARRPNWPRRRRPPARPNKPSSSNHRQGQ